jgi:hypothetical protein
MVLKLLLRRCHEFAPIESTTHTTLRINEHVHSIALLGGSSRAETCLCYLLVTVRVIKSCRPMIAVRGSVYSLQLLGKC